MNEQEQAWAGAFGDDYTKRNTGRVDANRHFFRRALRETRWHMSAHIPGTHAGGGSIFELGCGAGENLAALRQLYPFAHLAGLEINPTAAAMARGTSALILEGSILDYEPRRQYELTFTKGVLIHIPPLALEQAYRALVESSSRWVLVAEYYNPQPAEIPYRGRQSLLWKRDFAGDLMKRYQELKLIDYGFVYHGDPQPQDDLTWFLMEKRA